MEPIPTYFTRSQISTLTKVPDDVLNYWMREGVLVPREGGEGRGQHRKFDFYEINLASLLDQVRTFGLNLPALMRLAQRFHQARDYMDELGITRLNCEPLQDLIWIKRRVEEEGTAEVFLAPDSEYPGIAWQPYPFGEATRWAHITLQQALAVPATWIRRGYPGDHDQIAAHGREIIDRVDPAEFRAQWVYWSLLTAKVSKEPDTEDGYSAEPEYLYRDAAGEWHISSDIQVAKASLAFIGINVDGINWRTWHGRQPNA